MKNNHSLQFQDKMNVETMIVVKCILSSPDSLVQKGTICCCKHIPIPVIKPSNFHFAIFIYAVGAKNTTCMFMHIKIGVLHLFFFYHTRTYAGKEKAGNLVTVILLKYSDISSNSLFVFIL